MKLKRAVGLTLATLGSILLVLAPVWRWWIGPSLVKLPLNLESVSVFDGSAKVFVNRKTLSFYPPGREEVIPLRITATEKSVPQKSGSKYLYVEEKVEVIDASTDELIQGAPAENIYLFDRRTSENVPGVVKGVDREGYSLKFPIGAEKKDYRVWDDDIGKTVEARYRSEKKVDGERYRGVTAYVYEVGGSTDRMVRPPPGLPSTITGGAIKQMLGDTSLPLTDETRVTIPYFKKTEAVQVVEPRTGIIVDTPSYSYEYYVNAAVAAPPNYIRLARVEYSAAKDRIPETVDGAAKWLWPIDLNLTWFPLICLITGAVLLAIGSLLYLSGRRTEEGPVGKVGTSPGEESS